jgi:hypothetical protein
MSELDFVEEMETEKCEKCGKEATVVNWHCKIIDDLLLQTPATAVCLYCSHITQFPLGEVEA